MPAGRPSKYKSEYAEQAYKLALLGATDKAMADFFGVSESTFSLWKTEYAELSEALKNGKDVADATVASKLYNRAIGYDHKETVTASFQGKITDAIEVVKHHPPDTTAAIFWLKNRQRGQWRDKQEVEHSGSVEQKVNFAALSDEELKNLEALLSKAAEPPAGPSS